MDRGGNGLGSLGGYRGGCGHRPEMMIGRGCKPRVIRLESGDLLDHGRHALDQPWVGIALEHLVSPPTVGERSRAARRLSRSRPGRSPRWRSPRLRRRRCERLQFPRRVRGSAFSRRVLEDLAGGDAAPARPLGDDEQRVGGALERQRPRPLEPPDGLDDGGQIGSREQLLLVARERPGEDDLEAAGNLRRLSVSSRSAWSKGATLLPAASSLPVWTNECLSGSRSEAGDPLGVRHVFGIEAVCDQHRVCPEALLSRPRSARSR